jgi:BMFP domain-containing protein YqiC
VISETIRFTFNDADQQQRFHEMLAIGPCVWREMDETQREEIARLRADDEHSHKRIAELEAALRAALSFVQGRHADHGDGH